MSTSITRPDRRIRFDPEAARHAGHQDAVALLVERHPTSDPAGLLYTALVEIIALAHDDRYEECNARLEGFCEVIGPILQPTRIQE